MKKTSKLSKSASQKWDLAKADALLDELDDALLKGRAQRTSSILEQLWTGRRHASAALAVRLITGRAALPAVAFELLASFADEKVGVILRRIVDDPLTGDLVRLMARERLGWPDDLGDEVEAAERVAFLSTLRSSDTALLDAVARGAMDYPLESELHDMAIAYLQVLPPDRQRLLVEQIVAACDVAPALFLNALLHIPDATVQRLALAALIELRPRGCASAIDRLSRTAKDQSVRDEAAVAARRLRLRPVDSLDGSASMPVPSFERALASEIDGDGGQVILVIRQWDEEELMMADFFHKEEWGIKDCFGLMRATPDSVEAAVEEFQNQDIHLVEVDLPAVRGLLHDAIDVNGATGHNIPPVYEFWEPFTHDSFPPRADESVAICQLDDDRYLGRPDLLAVSAGLLDHPFFASWCLDYGEMCLALDEVPLPADEKLTARQYRPIIRELMTPAYTARLRQRLRRQAWLLDRTGHDDQARDVALAVAAALGRGVASELAKLPFLKAMVDRTVDDILTDDDSEVD